MIKKILNKSFFILEKQNLIKNNKIEYNKNQIQFPKFYFLLQIK
jgi:hypothetical protein